jgi:NapC/NirT cytochrome c family, N-terminal region
MAAESKFRYTRNPLTMFGGWLTTVSALLFLGIFFADLFGLHTNPYMGIVAFLVLPSSFVFGLVLMPVGAYLARRRERMAKPAVVLTWPVIDLNRSHTRNIAAALVFLTFVNIIVISLAAFRGVEYMDSPQFCGQVCHTVMQPEFTAYLNGPHARVPCVACHIGPGAPWFVKSKLSGTRQLFAVALNTYPRPIPSPVENLRPARDTCEQCHWPEKFTGDLVKQIPAYGDDEANTASPTTLRLHIGSGNDSTGATGIHWHMAPSTRITYITTDPKRETIVYVEVEDRHGVRKFRAPGVTDEQLSKGERRQMDCMDCHNRPSHRFAATPEEAVDDAISRGLIAQTLPFVRREAVAALKVVYPSQAAAAAGIEKRLSDFFAQQPVTPAGTRKADLARAIASTQAIYARDVFPSMKITWGTYSNNIGHVDSPGCFRCHDDAKKTSDGRVIPQDCSLCHTIE